MSNPVSQSIKQVQQSLPITSYKSQILSAIAQHDIIVLEAATGSGKSTQVPQYLLSQGYRVVVTQPRRVAAISLAQRVAEETGTLLGEAIGYQVRFEDCSSRKTRVKFVTDGMLLREAITDPTFAQYDVVIVDEVHERSLHTDFLLGLLKNPQKKLKVILMSATLNSHKLISFFDPLGKNSTILSIPGRSHPVQIFYTQEPEPDFLEAAFLTVCQIIDDHSIVLLSSPATSSNGTSTTVSGPDGTTTTTTTTTTTSVRDGSMNGVSVPTGPKTAKRADILVFLPGQDDILTLKQMLEEHYKATGPLVLPIYASLSKEEQMRIFDIPADGRTKVIIGTNIMESSITVSGLKFCVDAGLVKLAQQTVNFSQLTPVPASQHSLTQRAGRAGRESEGFCFRLFTKETFEALPKETPPEITRTDLAHVVLQFRAIVDSMTKNSAGFVPTSFAEFPLMDRPDDALIAVAERLLKRLGAVQGGSLTDKGRRLANMPLHPILGNVLEQDAACMSELLTLVAAISSDVQLGDLTRVKVGSTGVLAGFDRSLGDHVFLVHLFRKWRREGGKIASFGKAVQIRDQLKKIYRQVFPDRVNIDSCGDDFFTLRKAICHGMWVNIARRRDDGTSAIGEYETFDKTLCYIHPSSVVFACKPHPPVVVFSELQKTRKIYMRLVTPVEPEWLAELMPNKFRLVAD